MNNTCWLYDECSKKHCADLNGCLIKFKLDYLFSEALIPLPLRKHLQLSVDADSDDRNSFAQLRDIELNILDFVDNGQQLLIHSHQAGNGKTSWSLRLIQAYFKKIWLHSPLTCRGLFINVPSFLLALKNNISNPDPNFNKLLENIRTCDLVIWDDISNKVGTEFEINHLLSLIDIRLSAKKANIYTTNVEPKDLGKYLDIRLASRIVSASTIIKFTGGDQRGRLRQ